MNGCWGQYFKILYSCVKCRINDQVSPVTEIVYSKMISFIIWEGGMYRGFGEKLAPLLPY